MSRAQALEDRLATIFDRTQEDRVMAGENNWPAGKFGDPMNEVRSVVMHATEGWPSESKAKVFADKYIVPPTSAGGAHYYVSGKGSAYGLIQMPRFVQHANQTNGWAIGIESGNLLNKHGATPRHPKPTKDNYWRSLAPDAGEHVADVPGMKLWYRSHGFNEVIVSWWTTRDYAGPKRDLLQGRYMLFSEQQHRAWAMLVRFLCERYELPRNFPLLPHVRRGRTINDSETFRRIALADERFPMIVRKLAAINIPNNGIQASHFDAANAAAFEEFYGRTVIPGTTQGNKKHQNLCWTDLFSVYRGIHGHGFSGTVYFNQSDHDCPGAVFDWHRLAREVWDWWWYPFDLSDDLTVPWTAMRPNRRADGTTVLREYYFEAPDFEAKNLAYHYRTLASATRPTAGIFDTASSPSTFLLGSAEVPIYAPANGELVAARFPDTGDGVSMAFVLVRHEVFHMPDTLAIELETGESFPANPGRIDYDQEPSYVYSLVMHLARPAGFSFTEVTDANPDWLNRVLMRRKECDLVLELHKNGNSGIPQAQWNARPPGTPQRPTSLESWRADKAELDLFLSELSAGDVARGVTGRTAATPIRVVLGDFLGHGGVTRKLGEASEHGIRLEVFSSTFVPPGFQSLGSQVGWSMPAAGSPPSRPAIYYQSEWSKTPTAEERQRLQGIGVNPDLVNWWASVERVTWMHPTLPAHGKLISSGYAFHYRPLDFMRWLNEITWASEWPKYQVTDAAGNPEPMAPNHLRPRSRHV